LSEDVVVESVPSSPEKKPAVVKAKTSPQKQALSKNVVVDESSPEKKPVAAKAKTSPKKQVVSADVVDESEQSKPVVKAAQHEVLPSAKAVANAKKATVVVSDSDDEPLAAKKPQKHAPPTDQELKSHVASILANADLEVMTKKRVRDEVRQLAGDKVAAALPLSDDQEAWWASQREKLNEWVEEEIASM
jgi:hypothetical protein